MKAAVINKPGEWGVCEVAMPEAGDYDCIVRQLFGATCTGTDQHMIQGVLPFHIPYPTIMGHESVGRVISVGSKVRNFSEGDLISRSGHPGDPAQGIDSNWGGFSQYGLVRDHKAMKEDGCPKEEWDAYRVNQVIPEGIDPRAATMVITWRETFSFISRMGVSAGARVLVIGSGGNGLSYVSHARNLGASVVAMVGSSKRFEEGRRAGADFVFDYKDENLAQSIGEKCPEKFDFIIDGVGKSGAVDSLLELMADGATAGIYGIDDIGSCTIDPFKVKVRLTIFNGGYDEEESHDAIIKFIQDGKLDASIWLDLENPWPLDNIKDAFEALKRRDCVKALIDLE